MALSQPPDRVFVGDCSPREHSQQVVWFLLAPGGQLQVGPSPPVCRSLHFLCPQVHGPQTHITPPDSPVRASYAPKSSGLISSLIFLYGFLYIVCIYIYVLYFSCIQNLGIENRKLSASLYCFGKPVRPYGRRQWRRRWRPSSIQQSQGVIRSMHTSC